LKLGRLLLTVAREPAQELAWMQSLYETLIISTRQEIGAHDAFIPEKGLGPGEALK
jgi:hypothetical protein